MSRQPRQRRRFAALAIAAPLFLAACGSDDANRESMIASLVDNAELTDEEATCIADEVFTDPLVLTLDQDALNDAGDDPGSVPGFQEVVDTAIARCLGL